MTDQIVSDQAADRAAVIRVVEMVTAWDLDLDPACMNHRTVHNVAWSVCLQLKTAVGIEVNYKEGFWYGPTEDRGK